MNTYEQEQQITDRYGTLIINQVAATFYDNFKIERVTDRETQIKGVDYYIWKDTTGRCIKIPLDIKFDFYENHNIVLEEYQQYEGVGEQSWIHHSGEIYVVYFKLFQRKVYLMKTSDLQKFMETDAYKKRKMFNTNRTVNGRTGGFRNFRPDELPIDRIIPISLIVNPFETDSLLNTKPSLMDAVLYQNV